MAAKVRALQQWCKIQCEGYHDVNVTNMTSSWKSGLAFCAIIHRYRPDLIDYDSLAKENVFENNQLAFDTAYSLGIPKLLDAEDMVEMRVPDKLCIVTYVSQYYNFFRDKKPGGGGITREKSAVKRQQNADVWSSGPEAKKVPPGSPPARQDTNMSGLHENLQQSDNFHRRGTLSEKCIMCGEKVFLMERHMEGTKLYHRRCIRETQRATLKRESKASSRQKSQSHSSTSQNDRQINSSNATKQEAENGYTSHINTAKPWLNDSKSSPNRSPDNPFRKEMKETVAQAKPFNPTPVKTTPVIEREPIKVTSKFSRPSDFKTKTETELSPKGKLESPIKDPHHRNEFFNDLSPTGEQTSSPDPKKSKFDESPSRTKWGRDTSPVASSFDARISPKSATKNKDESSVFSGLLKSLAGVKKPKDFDEPLQSVYETDKTKRKNSWMTAPGETSADSSVSNNKTHGRQEPEPKKDSTTKYTGTTDVSTSSSNKKQNETSPRTAIRRSPPLPKFGSSKHTSLEKHDSFNEIFATNKEIVDQYGLGSDLSIGSTNSLKKETPVQINKLDTSNAKSKVKDSSTQRISNGLHTDSNSKRNLGSASLLETRLKMDKGEVGTPDKKIKDHNWLQKKKPSDTSKAQDVKPKIKQNGVTTEKTKSNLLQKEEKFKKPYEKRIQEESKIKFNKKDKEEDPKSIMKPRQGKDVEFRSARTDVKGSALIGTSDMLGPTNHMSAFNMTDSISLKKYRQTKENGEMSVVASVYPDSDKKQLKTDVYETNKSKDVKLGGGERGAFGKTSTPRSDFKTQTKEPVSNIYDKKTVLNKPAEMNETKPTWLTEKFNRKENNKGSVTPNSSENKVKIKTKPAETNETIPTWLAEKFDRKANDKVSIIPNSSEKVETKPAEMKETKPAWMLEAEKRQKARAGKYEDPEFAKVKQAEQEKRGKDQPEHSRNEPIKTHTKKTDTTTSFGSKPNELKTTTPLPRTEKYSHVSPQSSPNRPSNITTRKELNVEVSPGKSRFKSPETSPRTTTSQSPTDNAALVSILSKQLGRTSPGQSKSSDVIVPPQFGAHKVTSPGYKKDTSFNINGYDKNKESKSPIVSPTIDEINVTKPSVKPAWSEIRTSTPKVTTEHSPATQGDQLTKKVIAAPSGTVESEYVLAQHPSVKCTELKTRIVPETPFSFDSEEDLSEVDSVDSSNSDSAPPVLRDRGTPPVRKVNAEKRLSSHYILQRLNDLDIQLREMERQGRSLEEKIRSGTDDSMDDNDQMLQWFELISQKNDLVRNESELVHIQKQQELEDRHATLEYEIRCLMSIPEEDKSDGSIRRESVMLEELMSVVTQRNSIVDSLEDDRLRYLREDQEIQEMLQNKGFLKNESETEQGGSNKKKSKEKKKQLKEEKKRQKEEQKRLEKEKKGNKKEKKKKKSSLDM